MNSNNIEDEIRRSIERIRRIKRMIAEGAYPGIETGIDPLDELIGRRMPPSFRIVAGVVGVTSFLIQTVENTVRSGSRVLLFSLEHTAEWILSRIDLSEEEAKNFEVDDTYPVSVEYIEYIEKKYSESGGDVIIVDYASLMMQNVGGKSRYDDYCDVMESLRSLSRKLDVSIIAGVVAGREFLRDENFRKYCGDDPDYILRYLGHLAPVQLADVVMYLERFPYTQNDPVGYDPGGRVIVAKNIFNDSEGRGAIPLGIERGPSRLRFFAKT